MPQFFINSSQKEKNIINITNSDDINHIANVLRSKSGDSLVLIDEAEMLYSTRIIEIGKKLITAEILSCEQSKRKLSINLTLAQSVLKSNAQDYVIQKATELGTGEITPIITKYSVPKFANDKEKAAKVDKWQKFAFETCKQCERASSPKINPIISLKELMKQDFDLKIACIERSTGLSLKMLLRQTPLKKDDKILVVIGPEGGFADEEIKMFDDNGFKAVTLGNLILRAETAAVAAINNVVYEYEN